MGTITTIATNESHLKEIGEQIPKVRSELQNAETIADRLNVPTGTILPYGGPVNSANEELLIEAGWLPCDGRQVRKDKYPVLYKKIGNSWGKGDGVSTFNIPDPRGLFLRGVDVNGTRDLDASDRTDVNGNRMGPVVGRFEMDEFAKHSHSLRKTVYVHARSFKGENASDKPLKDSSGNVFLTKTDNAGGSETRPKNAYVYYLIKY